MYYLIYTFQGSNAVHLATDSEGNGIVAVPGNEHLLIEMANKLKDEGIIASAQLLQTVGDPF